MKHAGGRPTKYYKPTVELAIKDYLTQCGRENTTLPTLEGLAIHLGVNTDTIQEWKNKHLEFSVAIKEILDKQKQQLMDDGLYGGKEVNSTMAIFLLKVNHDMIEKSAIDLTSKGKELAPLVVLDTKRE